MDDALSKLSDDPSCEERWGGREEEDKLVKHFGRMHEEKRFETVGRRFGYFRRVQITVNWASRSCTLWHNDSSLAVNRDIRRIKGRSQTERNSSINCIWIEKGPYQKVLVFLMSPFPLPLSKTWENQNINAVWGNDRISKTFVQICLPNLWERLKTISWKMCSLRSLEKPHLWLQNPPIRREDRMEATMMHSTFTSSWRCTHPSVKMTNNRHTGKMPI